jgi:hypothetical protein
MIPGYKLQRIAEVVMVLGIIALASRGTCSSIATVSPSSLLAC